MKFFARKQTQRVTNFALAALLVVSTITASVPFIFSQKANAAPGVSYSTPVQTQSDWTVDRSVPSGGWTVDTATGTVTLNVDQANANTAGTFYQTEGVSKALAAGTDSIKGDVLVGSDWNATPNLRAGLWGVAQDAGLTGPSYPIIEYAANVSGYTGWRVWNANDGTWNNVAATTNVGGLNTVEIVSNFTTGNYDFYVNNSKVYSYSADGYTTFTNMILNNYNVANGNPADNYTVTWSNLQKGVLTPDYSNVYVATTGSDANYGTDAAAPFATIQKAINSVAANGTVHIANGTYTEKISFTKGNMTVVGESKAGVIIKPLSNEFGQGFTSENFGDLTISKLTIQADASTSGGSAMKFHNAKNVTLSNIAVNGTGYMRGIDINAVQGVELNNVKVNGFGKNGIAFTSQYATTDAFNTQAVKIVDVQSNGNGWAGIAFYTIGGGGASLDIPNVVFGGTNVVSGNGQVGIFLEGGTDAQFAGNVTPVRTISGPAGADLNLGNTTLSGNGIDVINYQTKNVLADSAVINGKIGSAMSSAELTAAEARIIDKNDFANYGDVILDSIAPAVPTNLTPADGTFTSDRGFPMTWNAVSGATVYQYRASFSKTDPNTLGSIIYADSSAVGSNYSLGPLTITRSNNSTPDATYFWQARAGDNSGNWSDWSVINGVTVDGTKPTVPVLDQPSNGSYLNTNEFDFNWNDSTDNSPLTYEFQGSQDPSRDGNEVLNGSNIWSSGPLPTSMIHSSGAGDGAWFYQVRAKDAAGNYSDWSNIWAVILDTQKPDAPTAVTPDWYIANGATKTLEWTAPTATDIDHYEYAEYNGTVPASDTTTPDWVNVKPASATSTTDTAWGSDVKIFWRVRAIDHAGNASPWSETRTIITDRTDPTATINSATVTNKHLDVQVTGDDNLSGIASISYDLYDEDGFVQTLKNDDFSGAPYNLSEVSNVNDFDTSELPSGNYTVRAVATDEAGNTSDIATSDVIAIDNETNVAVTTTGTQTTSTPTIEGTVDADVTDLVVTIDGVEQLGGLTFTPGDTTWSFTPTTPLADGTYEFAITATDGNLNSSTALANIVIDTPEPAAPQSGTTTSTPTTTAVVTPIITNPAAAAVLGATTENAAADNTGVAGATDDKTAAAVTSDANQGKVFGLAWYWWILILAGLAAIAWFIIAAIRRRNEEQA